LIPGAVPGSGSSGSGESPGSGGRTLARVGRGWSRIPGSGEVARENAVRSAEGNDERVGMWFACEVANVFRTTGG